MKAEIIAKTFPFNRITLASETPVTIRIIVVPEANNLAVSYFNGELSVGIDFRLDENCRVIKEIDVPDDFLKDAIAFMGSQQRMIKQCKKYLE